MVTLLERRQKGVARMGYLLVIEGCPYAFTDIEDIVGTTYISDGREILPGLDLPASLTMGLNVRAGVMKEYSTAFRVMDTHDGVIADLFRATFDDANAYRLNERMPATDDPANATYNLLPGLGTVDPRSKHIGTEYIDSSRNRRSWYIHPGTHAAPFDHTLSAGELDAHPILELTEEPRVWAGRQIALHELVYDEDDGDWGTWADQWDSGSLIWRGTMQGRGRIIKTAQYEIKCDGPASLCRRTLNRRRPTRALAVTPSINPADSQKGIAVVVRRTHYAEVDATNNTHYQSSIFDASKDLTATTRDALMTELSALLDDVTDGTTKNYLGSGATLNEHFEENSSSNSVDLVGDKFQIRYLHSSSDLIMGVLSVCMHVDYWALLGYDPPTQKVIAGQGATYYRFRQFNPQGTETGIHWPSERDGATPELDFTDYWVLDLQTWDPSTGGSQPADNDGNPRVVEPLFPGGVVALHPNGRQELSLHSGPLYLEGQKAMPPGGTYGDASDRPTINGNQVNAMGWFLLEGDLARGESQFADVDFEPFQQVARCCWYVDSSGQVGTNAEGNPTVVVECLEDPRAFGFESKKIEEPWLSGGTTTLTATPLAVWGYQGWYEPNTYPDDAFRLIPRIMLASGTSGAWGTSGIPAFPAQGDNQPTLGNTADAVSGDVEIADLGLNIEGSALNLISFRELAEKTLQDGLGDPLGKVKLAKVGPVQAEDLLSGLLSARGWCMGYLRTPGDDQPQFAGVDVFSSFEPADLPTVDGEKLHITESDLAGFVDNPDSWVPRVDQGWRSPVDAFDVQTRATPRDGPTFERDFLSMDPGSYQRSGAARWTIKDPGLSNPRVLQGAGLEMWQWEDSFRHRWSETIAAFMALPNRTITLNVSHPKGQYCYPGQPFLLTNVSVNSLDGQSIGVEKAQCVVLEHKKHLGGRLRGNHTITALMLGIETTDGFANVWGGSAKVSSFVDNGGGSYTFTCEADWLNAGHGGSDVSAFEAPDWSSGTGSAVVRVYQSFDLESFPTANTLTGTVTNVDTGAETVTLTISSGTLYRDTLKVLTLAAYNEQTAGAWPLSHKAWHTDGLGGTHTSGVQGKKLQ